MSPLIEGLLDAAWLVEPQSLRVLAANAQAATLLGIDVPALCRTDALALAATPQDVAFWEAARSGAMDSADVPTVLSDAEGKPVPVPRLLPPSHLGPTAESRPCFHPALLALLGP